MIARAGHAQRTGAHARREQAGIHPLARPVGVASPGNHDYLRGLGASAVFDYHAADWARQALTRVAGRHTRGKIVLRIGQ